MHDKFLVQKKEFDITTYSYTELRRNASLEAGNGVYVYTRLKLFSLYNR